MKHIRGLTLFVGLSCVLVSDQVRGQPVSGTVLDGVCSYGADFESDAGGWTQGADTCTAGSFVVGAPDATAWQVSGGNPGRAFFTSFNSGGVGTDDVDGGTCEALSPIVDCSGQPAAAVTLDYFHGQRDAGDDASDGFTIEVLSEGQVVDNLVVVQDVTHTAAWASVSTIVANPGDLQVRVRATDAAGVGDIIEGGIDNVQIFPAPPPLPCGVMEDFSEGTLPPGWVNDPVSTCTTGSYVVGEVSNPSGGQQVVGSFSVPGSVFTAVNTSAGVNDVDGGNCVLGSPTWSVGEDSTLSLWYWHGQRDAGDDAEGDFFRLELSTDGGISWGTLASNGDETSIAAWTQATADIPADSAVQLRLQCSDGAGTGDIVECGIDDVSICSTIPEEPQWPETSPHTWVAPGDSDLALSLSAELIDVIGQTHHWLARAVDPETGTLVVEISATVDYGPVDTLWTVTAKRFENRWGFEPVPQQTIVSNIATEYDDNSNMVLATTGHLTWLSAFLGANQLAAPEENWTSNGCNWPCSQNWRPCCDIHDACYCQGGDSADRKACDDAFRGCLRQMGMEEFKAFFYYWALRIFGGWFFNFSEEQAYQELFEKAYDLTIPAAALDASGIAVLQLPVAAGRDVAIELGLETLGPGDYRLSLSSLGPILVPTLDAEGEEIGVAELASRLAQPFDNQDVFCRREDGKGGAVAWAQLQLVDTGGTAHPVLARISNDALIHAERDVIDECGTESASTNLVPFDWLKKAAGQEEKVLCVSWFSDDCKKNDCNGQSCGVSLAQVLKLARQIGCPIPAGATIDVAIDLILQHAELEIGGYCGEVWFLGLIPVGCQCIVHTFSL